MGQIPTVTFGTEVMKDIPGLHLNLNLDSHLCPARINLVTLASDFMSLRCPPPRAMGFPGWKDLAHHVSSPPPSYLKYEVMVIPASQIYTHTFLVLFIFFFFFTKLLLPELIQNSLIQINYQRNILEQSELQAPESYRPGLASRYQLWELRTSVPSSVKWAC